MPAQNYFYAVPMEVDMQDDIEQSTAGHVYRVDKFVVPNAARDEFLARVQATHDVLRQQPGFVRDNLLEQFAGPGEFNFVTVVEWEDQTYIVGARKAVMALHEQLDFNPQALYERLDIRADIANYQEVMV